MVASLADGMSGIRHVFRCLTCIHSFDSLQLHPPSNLAFSPQNWVDNLNLNIQYIISVIIQNFAVGLISYLGYAPYNFHPFPYIT